MLERRGSRTTCSDPYVPHLQLDGRKLTAQDAMTLSGEADCVVIVTDHASFDYAAILERAKLVVDTRNALKNHPARTVERL